jgi:multidrug efflux pump
MMIDFALGRRTQEGKAPREAPPGLHAALPADHDDHLAALLAALPLMLGAGVGSELRHPLGVTMVGGFAAMSGAHRDYDARDLSMVRSVLEE